MGFLKTVPYYLSFLQHDSWYWILSIYNLVNKKRESITKVFKNWIRNKDYTFMFKQKCQEKGRTGSQVNPVYFPIVTQSRDSSIFEEINFYLKGDYFSPHISSKDSILYNSLFNHCPNTKISNSKVYNCSK